MGTKAEGGSDGWAGPGATTRTLSPSQHRGRRSRGPPVTSAEAVGGRGAAAAPGDRGRPK